MKACHGRRSQLEDRPVPAGASTAVAPRLRRGGRVAAVAALVCLVATGCGMSAEASDGGKAGQDKSKMREFPAVDEASLTPAQKRFVKVVKAEYAAQRPGKTYAEGVDEPWCSDFVSWVAKESGAPLKNPHSGSWRIPGVWTLRESLQKAGTFRGPKSGYRPKLGDIVMYDEPSPFGHHTNYVLGYKDGVLTTIGGNEFGGVKITENRITPELALLGYGVR